MADTEDGQWFGGRRWTGIAAVGVLAVIGLCTAYVIYGHHTHTTNPNPTTAAAAGPQQSVGSAPTNTSQLVPSSSPPRGVGWVLINGYAVPTSGSDGPRHVTGTVASGFAHTPTGALLALVNAQLRLTASSPTGCAAEAAAAIEHSPAGDQIAQQCLHPSGPAERYQIAGYTFIAYTDQHATITYAVRDEPTARLIEITGAVSWTGSDWIVSLPGAGTGGPNPFGPTAVIDSLAGLIAWSGA